MSLESALQENTKALTALIAVWAQLTAQAKVVTAEVDAGKTDTVNIAGAVSVKVDAKKPAVTQTAPATDTKAPAASVPAATASASPSEVTYEAVSAAITAKVKVDRDHVVATLTAFGAKKGTELKAERYADFLKALG